MHEPSERQQAIYDWVDQNPWGNLVVNACAGSGKSFTAIQTFYRLPKGTSATFVAFNKHIANNLVEKLPKNTNVKTYHALGLGMLYKAFGKPNLDDDKERKILETLLDKYSSRYLYGPILQLVGLVKNNLVDPTRDNLDMLVERHGVDTYDMTAKVYQMTKDVVNKSKDDTKTISFDDMCWLPCVYELQARPVDFIAVDELQDTCRSQKELVKKLIGPSTAFMGVGDRKQAIYSWRGANATAIQDIIDDLQADELPLDITYRNPKSVVDLVNQTFPEIPFRCYEKAEDGIVRDATPNQFRQEVSPDDMILCRCNAPLVAPCFSLIRNGIKATILGRDIGKGLTTLIQRMNANDVRELCVKLEDYKSQEVERLLASNKDSLAQAVIDKVDTIEALSDNAKTVWEIQERINTIFSDDKAAVTFSSVHKAKGLEADRVFILEPNLMPHPMARQAWQKQEETNVKYVAYTRPRKELIFVR